MQTILKKQFVQLEASERAGGGKQGAASAARVCAKQVELLRVGGVVQALEITCSCGEKTVVELDYIEGQE